MSLVFSKPCRITTPFNIDHPILQTHVKKLIQEWETVAALGTYQDKIISPEIDNALKLG
jgi:hypothetical protein